MPNNLIFRLEEADLELFELRLVELNFFIVVGVDDENSLHVVNGILGTESDSNLDHFSQLFIILAIVKRGVGDRFDNLATFVDFDLC